MEETQMNHLLVGLISGSQSFPVWILLLKLDAGERGGTRERFVSEL